MLRIGLTGGIGSGKSTAAALFATHGTPVIDADDIAKQLVVPDQPAYREIIEAFGDEILDTNNHINRDRLRRQVFDDPQQRQRLETILHPRVRTEIENQVQHLVAPYGVIVIPLLIEANQRDLVDRVLVVDADEDVQLRRVAARSDLTDSEIRKIMATQIDRDVRLRFADDVISNNGDLADLEARVAEVHARYLSLAQANKS